MRYRSHSGTCNNNTSPGVELRLDNYWYLEEAAAVVRANQIAGPPVGQPLTPNNMGVTGAGLAGQAANFTPVNAYCRPTYVYNTGYSLHPFTVFGFYQTPAVWPPGNVGWLWGHQLNHAGAYHLNGAQWNFVMSMINNIPGSQFLEDPLPMINGQWYFCAAGINAANQIFCTNTSLASASVNPLTFAAFVGTRNLNDSWFNLGNSVIGAPVDSSRGLLDEWGTVEGQLSIAALNKIFNTVKNGAHLTLAAPRGNDPADIVADWASRVVINGGAAPSAGTQAALVAFLTALNAGGILTKMLMVNPLVPDSLTAAITPLIKHVGGYLGTWSTCLDPWINVNFVAGDLTINGLLGNLANKHLDTGFIPLVNYCLYGMPTPTSGGLTVYVSATANGEHCGASRAINVAMRFYRTVNTIWQCWSNAGGQVTASIGSFNGYLSANRTAANFSAIFRANSVTPHGIAASIAITAGTVPDLPLYAFSHNNNNIPQNPSGAKMSFIASHDGLTQAESLIFYNAVQALRIALGGGWI